ncbi:OsmC family protein [Effusibacillus pohliae]|uniref:OsmC family protein n=1 Tax=Effusibacillus pohliae TaxID=232270 RepID=UPI0003749B67
MSGALAARQIPSYPDKITANVQGVIEAVERVLRITRINVHFELKIPQGTRETAERVLAVFDRGCPVAQTLKGSVEFHYTWTIHEY